MSCYRNEDGSWSVIDEATGKVLVNLPDEETAWKWIDERYEKEGC